MVLGTILIAALTRSRIGVVLSHDGVLSAISTKSRKVGEAEKELRTAKRN
jgi:hypothetical protein